MQREYMGVYPGSGKEDPTSRGEYCISLHLSACVGVTSYERGKWSHVSRKGKKSILLGMLILEAGRCLVVSSFVVPSFPRRVPAFPFIGSSEGRGVDKTLGRCLKGEGSTGAVGVAVATCSRNGQPSSGYHGDIRDGTVKDPGSYGEWTCRHYTFVDR
jgi:hypothetical protein